jgi:peptidoglycan/xylan/chitin deacetylase (PgdA/CDA1 family)
VALFGAALAAHYLPSALLLGQWTNLQALPFGWCRWRGDPTSDALAITFNDGPSPETTPRTLELLDALDLQATFFVYGVHAARYGDLVTEIVARGHEVGIRGQHAAPHLLRSPWWIRRDLEEGISVLEDLGIQPRWYRPPFGQLTARSLLEARRHDLEVVLWSAWGREWDEERSSAVLARLMPGLLPGAIVLLHDTDLYTRAGTAARTHDLLEPLADILLRLGLESVPLGGLLPPGAPKTRVGKAGFAPDGAVAGG